MAFEHTAGRYRFLDGLRGWAAVVVLFHHTFVDGLPANIVMANRAVWAPVFFLSGGFAVSVFFVISGFSLSIRYLETGDEKGLVRLAAGRYVRLALPIFTICAITYLLLILEVIPPAMQRPSPLNEFVAFEPNLSSLLNFSLINVFVSHSPTDTYDPPLWTMSYEFIGSFMVFSIVAVVRSWQLRSSSSCNFVCSTCGVPDVFCVIRSWHFDCRSVPKGRSTEICKPSWRDLVCRRISDAVVAVRSELHFRGDVPNSRRCIFRTNSAVIRKSVGRLFGLYFLPTLPRAGRCNLFLFLARAQSTCHFRLRTDNAALASRQRHHPGRNSFCRRILSNQRYSGYGVASAGVYLHYLGQPF